MLGLTGRSNPLVVVFTALCSGILFYHKDLPAFLFCAAMLLLLASRSRIPHALMGFILGFVSANLAPSWVELKDGLHVIQGVVCESYYDTGTYSLILRKVTVDGTWVRGYARLNVHRNVVVLGSGSVISAKANIRGQTGLGNEHEFDYKKFLLSKNIVLKGSIDSADHVEIRRYVRPHGLKHDINTSLSRLASPESEILKAMITGDTSGITDTIRDSFNSLGISHLIAISGLHMSIVICICYSIIFCLLRLIPPLSLRIDAPLIARTGAIIGVAAYTLFVGPHIPTLRAGIMASCVILGFFLKRRAHVLDALSFAGIIVLIFWPHSIYSASFLLSFSAVLGIIATMEKGAELPGWFLLLIIPVVAAAFTMPIIIYLFGFISYAGIIVNIVVVPFFSIAIMPLGIFGLLVYPLSGTLASFIFSLDCDAIGLLLHLSNAIGSMIAFPRPWLFWVFICYGSLIVAFFAERKRLCTLVLAFLSLAIVSVPLVQHYIAISRPLCFDFISVGQGDSTLITKGAHVILIDAGPSQAGFDTGRYVVAPHLLRRGITALDLVIVTHMHPDHAGGIPYILERLPVKGVWVNSTHCGNPCFDDVDRVARRKDVTIKEVGLGEKLYLGDMSIHVLGPIKPWHLDKGNHDENMRSVVVLAGDKSMKGLFMGDADMLGELVLTHLRMDIRAHILKVAHHGSRRSCLEPFLDEVMPEIAVISCGANNAYGDPSPDPLQRLRNRGISTYRTDIHGGVTITSLSPSFKVKSGRLSADIH